MYILYQDTDRTYTLYNSDDNTRTHWYRRIHETFSPNIPWQDYSTSNVNWKVIYTFEDKPTIDNYPELFL